MKVFYMKTGYLPRRSCSCNTFSILILVIAAPMQVCRMATTASEATLSDDGP